MKPFLSEDFLLASDSARRLYFDYAESQPIVDWHCHIPASDFAENRRFRNITELWLGADHYKWRAMRQNGIPEEKITGSSSDREKFDAWACTLSRCIGNPLYHWTHLELSRCFDIHEVLNENTAEKVWDAANAVIASPDFCARSLLQHFKVNTVFTTDDPSDCLAAHALLSRDGSFPASVLPAFRPERALHIEQPVFPDYIRTLGASVNLDIRSFDDLKDALHRRMDDFDAMGCRAADQSFTFFPFLPTDEGQTDQIFRAALGREPMSSEQAEQYMTALLNFLAREYASRGWAIELHIGAMRDNNSKMFAALGADSGFDSICDAPVAQKLSRFLDSLCSADSLPKTVLFPLNPADSVVLASMAGNFAEKTCGRMQLGAAWWFNDHLEGMETQIKTYANFGVLASFIGMVTDSRSLLSYPRHEYFRRIFCNLLGSWVEQGELPADFNWLGTIVQDVCSGNAVRFFNLQI